MCRAGEAKPPEHGSHGLDPEALGAVLLEQVVHRVVVHIQDVDEVLRVPADDRPRVPVYASRRRLKLPSQDAHHRRLPRTVRPDHRDARLAADGHREAFEPEVFPPCVGEGRSVELDHIREDRLRGGPELEADGVVDVFPRAILPAGALLDPVLLLESLPPLLRVLDGAEALAVLLEFLVLLLRHPLVLELERLVVSIVQPELRVLEVVGVRADGVEELPVVGDDDEALLPTAT
mmetsp:Transcript_25703/g.61908  ORF Transcript_25703/g.61908 Transcript_25703/m.61908 type:complete len:234 (-) Transcript_25703:231-932(-)